jgi:predicted GIY-YIG superfamily endonuclease
VYILHCADDTFYVGHADDLDAREKTHNDGFGSRYTAARRPVQVVYSEECASLSAAVSPERQLKRWSATK